MSDIRAVVLSGPSGSGKSTAIKALEDLGYYCALAAGSDRGPSALGEAIHKRFADAEASGAGHRFVSRLLDPDILG